MLLLVREENDKGIVVELPTGELLEIFVDKITGKKVRLGFKNDEGLKVWSGEIYDKIEKEKRGHKDH